MTVREHARLQSFPDWFDFKGPYTTGGTKRKEACPKYTQVGNAVPPLLAEAIGEVIVDLIAVSRTNNFKDFSERGNVFCKSASKFGEFPYVDPAVSF